MYTLTKTIRLGLEIVKPRRKKGKATKVPWSVIRDNGDFRRTIDFTVSGDGPKTGVIFQYIQNDYVFPTYLISLTTTNRISIDFFSLGY